MVSTACFSGTCVRGMMPCAVTFNEAAKAFVGIRNRFESNKLSTFNSSE